MKILYVSSLCGPELQKYIWSTSSIKPVQSVQKFHRLLVQGFAMHSGDTTIDAISSIPVTSSSHPRKWWNLPVEQEGRISYRYLPFINLPYVKNAFIFFLSFISTIRWIRQQQSFQRVVICDVLNLSITSGALFGARIMGQKVAVIITDLPGMMVPEGKNKSTLIVRIFSKLVSRILSRFDYYILLTEQMNTVVNPANKPYLVMEGLVNVAMSSSENLLKNKSTERILIYAGAVLEIYGVKKLIEAFMKLEDKDVRLDIYGAGDMGSELADFMSKDKRVRYKGVVPNSEVVENLEKATLLINPRPANEEFTKYSFPSKNMEYMVSGTPVATTKLQGMPKEYYPFVYLLNDESVQGISTTLSTVLSKSREELHNFGKSAKEFVLANKSNYIQAERILQFLK